MNSMLPLQVEIQLETSHVRLYEPCMVHVQLTNIGASPVRINQRMAVGYRESLSRELFVDILDASSRRPVRFREIDYDREFPSPDDYVLLQPDNIVYGSFNLFKWYLPSEPGIYQIIVFYQADEPLAKPPTDIIRGVYTSQPVEFVANKNEQRTTSPHCPKTN